jgi:hypothetical protein
MENSENSVIDVLASGETDRLTGLLADDVVFSSPVTDYRGRSRVAHLLGLIARSLQELRTTAKWDGETEAVSAFTALAGGNQLEGMLREQRNTAGAVAHVTLFLRPYQALKAAIGHMRELLEEEPLPGDFDV